MKLLSLLSTLAVSIHAVHASQRNNARNSEYAASNVARSLDQDAFEHLMSRQNGQLVTQGTNGSMATRLEIRQLYSQQPDQWTLLILGLEAFHAQSQTNPLSYFGISKIHGIPRGDWNGVPSCGSNCNSASGYCPHDMCIFPTWHRAYLALFEQQFLAAVFTIANNWPSDGRARMQAAAANMRFPYYDWAAAPANNGQAYPTQMSDAQVTINAQSGQRTLPNPLASHLFSDPSVLSSSPWRGWKNTLKYPTSNSASATSRPQNVINAIGNNRRNIRDQLYQLFVNCDNYGYFSNDAASSSSSKCSNSLEAIHGGIHNLIGGTGSYWTSGGHMAYLSVAAYDPAFWLHHMNVDRIFALWQAMNPDFTCNQAAPHNTYAIAANTQLNQDYPLLPFRRDTNNNFWTSNQVKDWRVFNYDYPEFANSDRSKAAITAYVNRLYAPNATYTAGSSKRTVSGSIADKLVGGLTSLLKASNGSEYQYVANIKAPRYALNGTYNVYAFNGAPNVAAAEDYPLASNLIGLFGVLSMPNMQDMKLDVAGSIPLTSTLTDLVAAGKLSSLKPAQVTAYLQKNLQWRIVGVDGAAVAPDTIPGFVVSVYTSTSSPATNEYELPKWSSFIKLQGISASKDKTTEVISNVA